MKPSLQWTHLSSANGQLPVAGPLQQTLCLTLDADGDGRDEIVIGCRKEAPALTWLRPIDGAWQRSVIEAELLPIEAGGAAFDVDGDGLIDIVAGEDASGDKLYWWRNPGPPYDADKPWQRYLIKSGGGNMHHDQIFGDFDGDGRAELVFWNQRAERLFHAPIPADPINAGQWSLSEIYQGRGEGLAAGDIDGDGKLELLAGGRIFKRQSDGNWAMHVVDEEQNASRIAVGDLNGDGHLEIVMAPADSVGRLKWYERGDDPLRAAWIGHDLLARDVVHGHSLALADFTGDGNLDIFCGEMRRWSQGDDHPDCQMWLFLGDGNGGFETTVIAQGMGVHEAKIGDFRGNGTWSIAAKPYSWQTPRTDVWLSERVGN